MRNFILLFVAALFVGCASPGVQVTTDDEKSQAIKAAYDGYLVNDFTASNELYSEEEIATEQEIARLKTLSIYQ